MRKLRNKAVCKADYRHHIQLHDGFVTGESGLRKAPNGAYTCIVDEEVHGESHPLHRCDKRLRRIVEREVDLQPFHRHFPFTFYTARHLSQIATRKRNQKRSMPLAAHSSAIALPNPWLAPVIRAFVGARLTLL